jgi:hypothetical protein
MARIMSLGTRAVWFVAGSVAGVYATAKARRAAYRLSMPGLVDQAGALGQGWRAFSDELHDGMQARERDIARRLTGAPHDLDRVSIDPPHPTALPDAPPDAPLDKDTH